MALSEVNGVGLWCETQGTSGSPVIMVHGSWGDHHKWDLVAPRLAERHVVLTPIAAWRCHLADAHVRH